MKAAFVVPLLIAATTACASPGVRTAARGNFDPIELLANADLNRDGTITKIEFVDSRGQLFDHIDRNRDGHLSRDDVPRRRRGNQTGGGGLAQLQGQLDVNNDGRVSRLEFTDGPVALFDRADVNRDERIDPSELAALRSLIASRRGS